MVLIPAAALMGFASICSASQTLPEGWGSLDGLTASPRPPRLNIVESSAGGLVVRVALPGILGSTVVHGETEYRRLELPSYYRTTEVGHPEVPVIRQMIALPHDCDVSIEVTATDSVTFSGPPVYPAPEI
ncbi:MAG: hypothetical protein GF400_03940, partial [Candidatus Eisenbacteria bacterium]|nr:hypothetical protein [Candidatus Eisenbacteria bacterium]